MTDHIAKQHKLSNRKFAKQQQNKSIQRNTSSTHLYALQRKYAAKIDQNDILLRALFTTSSVNDHQQ